MPAHKILTATLDRARWLSQQTRHLEFCVEGVELFNFQPGQFVSIREPRPDGKSQTRAYSMASAPNANRFDLCLNRVPEGFMSNYLCDLHVGHEIHFHGPHGLFVLRQPVRDSLFICTGTGVAPLRAMTQWLFAGPERHRGRHFWLIYGTRWADDLYYFDEFNRLQQHCPNFHYIATLSRADDRWTGHRGYVTQYVRELVAGRQPGSMDAYICGLQTMVNDNRELLLSLGWDKQNIVYERYD